MQLHFLGTGASGGTPGEGRSRRRESSATVSDAATTVLLDVTRHAAGQLRDVRHLDAVALTHGHRDASGGAPALRSWLGGSAVPVLASRETHHVLRHRYRRLDHLEVIEVEPGEVVRVGTCSLTPADVPHADRTRFRTYAWRVDDGRHAVVYASDVAALTDDLRELAAGADVLVLDGAMYGRSMFTHLRIEEAVPAVCAWPVGRIVLTQIGRTAPPHDELVVAVAALCWRAVPAHDGLTLTIGDPPGQKAPA